MAKDSSPSKITVDFSNVGDRTEGGRAAHVPEGDYLLKVTGAKIKSKKDDDSSKYIAWTVAIVKPSKYANAGTIFHNTTLKSDGLWSLRNLLEDMGLKVPKKSVEVPLATIVAKQLEFGATLADDEYNAKTKSKIVATFKKADYEAAASATTDSTKPAASKDEDDEDEEESDSDDEDLDELDVDDL